MNAYRLDYMNNANAIMNRWQSSKRPEQSASQFEKQILPKLIEEIRLGIHLRMAFYWPKPNLGDR